MKGKEYPRFLSKLINKFTSKENLISTSTSTSNDIYPSDAFDLTTKKYVDDLLHPTVIRSIELGLPLNDLSTPDLRPFFQAGDDHLILAVSHGTASLIGSCRLGALFSNDNTNTLALTIPNRFLPKNNILPELFGKCSIVGDNNTEYIIGWCIQLPSNDVGSSNLRIRPYGIPTGVREVHFHSTWMF